MANLCIDIGNTRIKMGWFEGTRLLTARSLLRTENEQIHAFLTNHTPENIIYSTVAESLPQVVRKNLPSETKVLELSPELNLPVSLRYKTPETLGRDRLAAVIGAQALYPETNCLVIDAGTCITYDFLLADGLYLGGNISPGWQMRLDAMQHYTVRLPRPASEVPEYWVGDHTQSALQNGAFWGLCLEIQGYIDRWAAQHPAINVLLTGGDADFFAKKLKSKIFVNQNLVLWGLNKTLNYNV
ncbi:MAG TPA: type III pantothenate kinase [Saprospiraceae bacterium]|nr:type III pantothenate kinase [Saprospiraceae bacterium]